jgi:oligopeptidase A
LQESDLVELEETLEPTWPKLVEPLEKITDRLSVVWGVVNHLNAVKDSPELRSAIEEVQVCINSFCLQIDQSGILDILVEFHFIWNAPIDLFIYFVLWQPEKVKFQLRLGQSKLIYSAFKPIKDSSNWENLSEARKRIVEG